MPALRDRSRRSSSTRSTIWRTSIARQATSIARSSVLTRQRRDCPRSICCRSSGRSTSRRSRTSSCSRDGSKPRWRPIAHAVDLSRRARHADGLVQSLRMLGNALLGLARYDEALPCLQEAAQLFAQLEDRVSEAEMRSGIARILERTLSRRRGAGVERGADAAAPARRFARRARSARRAGARETRERSGRRDSRIRIGARAGGDDRRARRARAAIRNVLGILEWERGGYAAALRHYESALALVREAAAYGAHEAVILNSLGACLTRLGRPDEARTVLEESLALSREIGERQLEAHALAALGHVVAQRPRLERCRGLVRAVPRCAPRHRRPRRRGLDASASRRGPRRIGDTRQRSRTRRCGSRGRRKRRRRSGRRVRGRGAHDSQSAIRRSSRMPRYIIERSVPRSHA